MKEKSLENKFIGVDKETSKETPPHKFLSSMPDKERGSLIRPLIRNHHSIVQLEGVDPAILTEESRKKYKDDCEKCRLKTQESIPLIVEEIRKDPYSHELLNLIRPDDAVIMYQSNQSDISLAAENRHVQFKEQLINFICNAVPYGGDVAELIYEALLLESNDNLVRDDFFARKQEYLKNKEDQKLPVVSYGYFDPEQEVKKIASFAEEKIRTLSQDEYIAEKKKILEEFKKQFTFQVVGRMKLHAELEDILLKKGSYDQKRADQLRKCILKKSEKLRLSPVQLGRYEAFLSKLEDWNREMDNVQGELKIGRDDKSLFEKLYGVVPEGEVFVHRGPVSFFVDCNNVGDFAKARGESEEESVLIGGSSRGLRTIVKNNNGEETKKWIEEVRIHEERHSLKKLLDEMMEESIIFKGLSLSDRREIEIQSLNAIVENDLEIAKKRARDEIFAYLKDGSSIKRLRNVLLKDKSKGGIYDYLEEAKNDYHTSFEQDSLAESDAVFERAHFEYKKILAEVLDEVEALLLLEIPRTEIIAMLEFEPLDQWKRVMSRLESGGAFKQKRNNVKYQTKKEIKDDNLSSSIKMEKLFNIITEEEAQEEHRLDMDFLREKLEKIAKIFRR